MNQNIRANTVRLIDETGKQVGLVELSKALNLARDKELDLVEVASKADPPVVRIVDFKKFKYEEAKKERTARKKTRQVDTKEIWLGPLMSDHDLEVRMAHARIFLSHGDRVKLTVKFGGREIAHPEFGFKLLEKAEALLNEQAEKDSEPKMMGRNLSVSLKPTKGNKHHEEKNKQNS